MEERREKILDAAQKLFARFGLRKTSMDEIAKLARVAKTTLYNYFTGKEEMFIQILEAEVDNLKARIERAVGEQSDPQEKIRAFIISKIEGMREARNLLNLRNEEIDAILSTAGEILQRNFENELEILRGVLAKGVEMGVFFIRDIELTSYAVAKAVQGLEMPWVVMEREMEIGKRVDALLDVVFFGIVRR
jgi:AcrR family transcriptional regulator